RELQIREARPDRVVDDADRRDLGDNVAGNAQDAVLVLAPDRGRPERLVDVGDVAQVDGRAPGGAREERDGAQVLGAGEVLPREHHAQVELPVPFGEARGDGAVERGPDRLADADDVE